MQIPDKLLELRETFPVAQQAHYLNALVVGAYSAASGIEVQSGDGWFFIRPEYGKSFIFVDSLEIGMPNLESMPNHVFNIAPAEGEPRTDIVYDLQKVLSPKEYGETPSYHRVITRKLKEWEEQEGFIIAQFSNDPHRQVAKILEEYEKKHARPLFAKRVIKATEFALYSGKPYHLYGAFINKKLAALKVYAADDKLNTLFEVVSIQSLSFPRNYSWTLLMLDRLKQDFVGWRLNAGLISNSSKKIKPKFAHELFTYYDLK